MARSVVVTGSTSGIGLAIATAFAEAGDNVVVNGFGKDEEIKAIVARLESASKAGALYHPADMTKPAEIADLVETAAKTFGTVDVLVNNAGIQHVEKIEDFPIEKWDQIISINLSSSFHTMRAAIPLMKARKHGRIINIASAHGLVASPVKSAYVAAKHGILGLTKTAALELAEFGVTLALRASEGPRDRGGRPASTQPPATWLGAQWAQTGELRLTTVYRDGPAAHAGLSAQDVLVAIDGLKATGDMLGATLGRATPGTRIGVDAFRRDVLHHFEVELTAAPLDTAYLAPTADAPDDVVERRRAWLGG